MFGLKFNKVDRNALLSISVLLLMICILMTFRDVSMYQPRPIIIESVNDEKLSDLSSSLECVAGSGKKDEPYSVGLTPGGLCGASKLVNDQASYKLVDGIGGSLI